MEWYASVSACTTLDFPALLAPYISVIGLNGTRWVSANALKLAILNAVSVIAASTPAGASIGALADNLIHFNTSADVSICADSGNEAGVTKSSGIQKTSEFLYCRTPR